MVTWEYSSDSGPLFLTFAQCTQSDFSCFIPLRFNIGWEFICFMSIMYEKVEGHGTKFLECFQIGIFKMSRGKAEIYHFLNSSKMVPILLKEIKQVKSRYSELHECPDCFTVFFCNFTVIFVVKNIARNNFKRNFFKFKLAQIIQRHLLYVPP